MPETSSTAAEPGSGVRFGITSLAPNPAATLPVKIDYFLEKTAVVQVEVLDVLGQPVAGVFSGKQPAGAYTVSWDGSMRNGLRAQPGVYFVRLQVDDRMVVRELVWF